MTFSPSQSTAGLTNKNSQTGRYLLLIAIIVVFLVILMVTMDVRKDKARHQFNAVVGTNDLWIHDKGSELHYGIVLDCGSSGTRVFIYYWPDHNGNPEHLLDIQQMIDRDGKPVRMKVRPGLSSYEDKPQNASHYIYPLLRHAANHIPKSKHSETPLYILATAGMRLLSKQKQDAIINNLIKDIPLHFDFLFSSTQIEVITGKQEGIYAWITINYVLGRFHHSKGHVRDNSSSELPRKRTVGSLDMGGASTQITFEVPKSEKLPAHLTTTVNLGCDSHMTIHSYKLYVATFLGYGASTARSRYLDTILTKRNNSVHSHSRVYLDPCLPSEIRIKGTHEGMKYRLKGMGNFESCRSKLLPLLNKSESCLSPPCSFNGVHQPPISFNTTEFYGFSEFWYSVNDVLRLKGLYNAQKFDIASKEFCKTKWSVLYKRFQSRLYPFADEHRFMYQCFKSAWMTSVLHEGFKFPRGFKGLHPTFMIGGKEIQWTLGAILYRTRFLPLRDMQVKSKLQVTSSYRSWIYIGDSGFKIIVFICSAVVLLSVYIIFTKPRLIAPSRRNSPGASDKVSNTPNYPTDFRISL